ncbi:MAG TPA: hypothetical protein P5188_01315 [Flavobacterium sp.]|nr:hypothetical protein [Flavobacterium sp.]
MKRFLGFLVLLLTLNACDDGDFDIETFNFTDVNTNQCNSGANGFFIYKINNTEVLLVQIPESNFINEITVPGTPRTVNIGGANKVIYRIYDGTVTTGDICNTIPPATPVVTEEWNALAGTIEIVTTVNKTVDETLNSSIITGYTHNIILRNVNFQKGNGKEQLFESLKFGNYITSATAMANFDGFAIKNCATDYNFLYKISGSQALAFAVDATLFQNEVTPLDSPRTALIDDINQLELRYYNDNINDAFACTTPPLSYPVLEQKWVSEDGITGVSGMIEVTTTEEYLIPTDNQSPLVGYRQKVTLKKVTMVRNGVSFKLGDVYEYGEFVTPL